MGYIYKITNIVNNKCYIGQTIQDPIKRWQGHKNAIKNGKGCPYLVNAMKKYGCDNFNFKVLIITFDSMLDDIETENILKYNSLTPNGYNILERRKGIKTTIDGTNAVKNINISERMKKSEKWQKAVREKRVGWTNGHKHKNEIIQKISQSVKQYYSKNKHDAVDVLKHREAMARAVGKKIEQLDKETLEVVHIYPSIREAARMIGCARSLIYSAIKNQTCGYGYRWNYV